jgi:TRAP-type C4-dicarboxylate transport system permease small subunit
VRTIVGLAGGVALLGVGLLLITSRAGDPVQALTALVVGALCLVFGGLAIAFTIGRAIPRRDRAGRPQDT